MIEFKNVDMIYTSGNKALKNVNLKINEGEITVFIGPSGSGKTTALKMINRLEDNTSGEIIIKGKNVREYDIHKLRWDMGYVLQQVALFPHMNVEENISIVTLYNNFDLQDELVSFIKEKGYDVTLDSSEIEAPENQTPRLIILVRKRI